METGRRPNPGAPDGAGALVRILRIGAVLGLVAVVVLSVAAPAAAEPADPAFDPGGPGPSERATATALATPCPISSIAIERQGSERNRLIVAASYCAILKRQADADGLAYWSRQLDDGLTVTELIGVLVNSAEFQARRTRTFSQTLAALRLGPARLEQRREQQAALVAAEDGSSSIDDDETAAAETESRPVQRPQAEAERQAEAQRQFERWVEQERLIEEGKREARLRERNPITVAEFEAQVGAYGLDSIDPITPALIHGTLQGDRQPVNVAFVHLSGSRGIRVSPGDRGRSTVGTWASEIGAHVAINGNWYAPYDGPAVSDGVVYGGADHYYTSLFGFTAAGDLIFDHHRETSDSVDDRVVEGVSGHPTLIYRGERTTDFGGDPTFTSRQPRTAIGLDSTGDVLILVTVDGRRSSAIGMTGDETARLMERLGAFDAVMLDGGGSSTMWIADRGVVNRPSGGLRAVGNQLAVYGN